MEYDGVNKQTSEFVLQRADDMRIARTRFEDRWQDNNTRIFNFLEKDGLFHLAMAWSLVENMTDEISDNFDGSVAFIPTEQARARENFQYDYFSKIYNQENQKVYVQTERKMALKDALRYGVGVLFEGYFIREVEEKPTNFFDGLITERVDPRDFFIDNAAQKWYDPQGLSGATDCIRRRWYKPTTFKQLFQGGEQFNQAAVKAILDTNKLYSKDGTKPRSTYGGDYQIRDEGLLSIFDENELRYDLIRVYEYWSHDKLILQARGSVFYDGENPYRALPFAVYTPFMEYETLYPPSLVEVLTPMLKLKEVLANLWYSNARLSSTPIVFASDESGLIAGQQLRPGVQTVSLPKGKNINDLVQQVKLGGISQDLTGFLEFLDDEITKVSAVDQRALLAKPDELATQTLQKVETELKRLRGMIETMMISSETQRAILRGRNIIRFVMTDAKEIIINDFTMTGDKKLKQARGSLATITIDENEWQDFEFDVVIKSKKEHAMLLKERRDDLLRLLEIGQALMQNPEFQNRFRLDALFEEILKTFTEIDSSNIFIQDKGMTRAKEEMDMASRGMPVETSGEIGQLEKEESLRALMKRIRNEKDPSARKNLIQLLLQKNAQKSSGMVKEMAESPGLKGAAAGAPGSEAVA